MSNDNIESPRYLIPPPEFHVDPTLPEHGVNLRTAERVAAEAVSGKITQDDLNKALSRKADVSALHEKVDTSDSRLADARTPRAHATSHAVLGCDSITASDIGAMPPPPGTGKPYLAVGGGWVEYIPPECDLDGLRRARSRYWRARSRIE